MYNVKELRERLQEKVSELGISPKFQENPAYISALREIDDLISGMNMFEDHDKVMVNTESGVISFSYSSPSGDKYSLSISSNSPETFKCIKTTEKKPFVGTDGQTIEQKEALEVVTTISDKGFITIDQSYSSIDNVNCEQNMCNNTISGERKSYSNNGLMMEREYRFLGTGTLTEDIRHASINSMLYLPRQAFNIGGISYNMCKESTKLVRDKLDTARMIHIENGNVTYSATVPLNQEHGLQDMYTMGGEPFPEEVIIPAISQEQIEAMIARENNTKVQEDLRLYANGRDNYSYDSNLDTHFVCKTMTQGTSR